MPWSFLALLRAHGKATSRTRVVPRHGHQAFQTDRTGGVIRPHDRPRVDEDDLEGLDGPGRPQNSA